MSNKATSIDWPLPVRARATNAPRIALQAIIAVLMSITGANARTPSRSAYPFIETNPLSACAMGSNPDRSAKAPVRP